MQAFDYYQKYQSVSKGSTVAVRKPSTQDIIAARKDAGIDWHADQRTEAQ